MTYLDTHVVAWLYAHGASAVPEEVALRLERATELRISPMVRLELEYLYEIDRVASPPWPVLDALGAALDLRVCNAPFLAVIRGAEGLRWTRDPFDRLIVAQAALFDAPLVTRDTAIHQHYRHAVWT